MYLLVLGLALLVQAAAAAQDVIVRTFDDDKVGLAPAGFTLAAGRNAAADRWTVKSEGAGRVLVYEGKASPPDSFAVAIYAPAQYLHVDVSARLKTSGAARAAGLVWKYRDPSNHYSVQLDLLKQQLVMYRVTNGHRIRLERETDLELDPDAWHSLKVVQEGVDIRVYLGGIRVFSERDRLPPGPGAVGLWASGDSTVMFDDFRVEDETSDVMRRRAPAGQR